MSIFRLIGSCSRANMLQAFNTPIYSRGLCAAVIPLQNVKINEIFFSYRRNKVYYSTIDYFGELIRIG